MLPTLSLLQLWKGRSDPVLHIELRRWADLMVVAPLDANTLAKVANGICDNLLVSTQALPATAATPQDCLALVLLQHHQQCDLHVLFPLHLLVSRFPSMVPLLLLFPSLT